MLENKNDKKGILGTCLTKNGGLVDTLLNSIFLAGTTPSKVRKGPILRVYRRDRHVGFLCLNYLHTPP